MFVIFRRYFRDRRNSLIFFTVAGILLIWLYIAFYPLIERQSANLMSLMESLPKGMLKLFGVDEVNIFSVEGFLSFKHYNVAWPVMLIFLLSSLAGAGITGAIERGVMEIPMSCPISRTKFFMGIYLTGLISLFVFTVCSILSVAPLAEISGIAYEFKFHIAIAIHGLFLGWAVFSFAMLLSAVLSEPRLTYMILGGILFAMYILFILPGFVGSLEWMQYLSFFYYFDPNYVLLNNSINTTSLLVFSVISLLTTMIGAAFFNRRDISV